MRKLFFISLATSAAIIATLPAYSQSNNYYQNGYPAQRNYNTDNTSSQALLNNGRAEQDSTYQPFGNAVPEVPKHGLKGALGGLGHALGRAAQVAAPVAGGYMMMRAANNMMMPGAAGATGAATTGGVTGSGAAGVAAAAVPQSAVYGVPVGVPMGTVPVYPAYGYGYTGYNAAAGSMAAPMMMNAAMNMLNNH
ncbi:MAG TPA: hypothetical protein V6C72_09530 [Chroococcales cyanobacterium]